MVKDIQLSSTVKGSRLGIAGSAVEKRRIPMAAMAVTTPPSDIRQDIGVRNPYALAEVICERTGDSPGWVTGEPGVNQDLLSEILGCKYTKLFDPGYRKSPLFPLAVYATIGIKPNIVRPANKKFVREVIDKSVGVKIVSPPKGPGNPQRLMQATVTLGPTEPRATETIASAEPDDVKTGAQPCTDTGDHWGLYKVNGVVANYHKKGLGKRPDIIDDVTQGCTPDCWFMAALVSKAWCNYKDFPSYNDSGQLKTADPYTFTFYGMSAQTSTVNSCMILTQTGTPVFARPYGTNNELWHGIYEKAFAALLPNVGASPLAANNCLNGYPYPDMPKISLGNPLTAIFNLTNNQPTTFMNVDMNGKPQNVGLAFSTISSKITWKDGTNTQGVTTVPMAAWSYRTSAIANAVHPETTINYDNEIIVANHSYSILGVYIANKGTPNQKNYIVLRNPYGRLWGADPTLKEIADWLYTGAWALEQYYTRSPSVNDGIFALEANRFELYFEGYGWNG